MLLIVASVNATEEKQVMVHSAGWELIGDLRLPDSEGKVPAVLLLNKAAGDRRVYEELAAQLAERGVASLRLDLRGHGESTNLDRFVPGESDREARDIMIAGADEDVIAVRRFLASHPRIDPQRVGIVGASYSGEEMADAGRKDIYANAYVALSPGSFSDESINSMDESKVPWLFVAAKEDRFLREIVAAVQSATQTVEILYLPGDAHGTNILISHPEMAERIAVWLAMQL